MEKIKKEFPDNLYSYYQVNVEQFHITMDKSRFALYVSAGCLLILLFVFCTDNINFNIWAQMFCVTIFLSFVGIGCCLFEKIMVKENQNFIKNIVCKNFDLSLVSEYSLIDDFYSENFEGLFAHPTTKRNDVTLWIDQDSKGKKLYCLLLKKVNPLQLVGISKINIISGATYDEIISLL